MKYLLLLTLFGCAQTNKQPLARGPLIELYIRVDPRYKGLVNQTCEQFEGSQCKKWNVAEYDLSDADTNKLLVSLKFICYIGAERFGICGNGFCQKTYRAKKFAWFTTGWEQYTTKIYNMEKDKKFLVEAGTHCLSWELDRKLYGD